MGRNLNMASENLITYDCLSIKITTATFAQPRSYFVTAQCIHQDSNIDDSINSSIPKYRTATSKATKTPSFNAKKPIVIKLPKDIELSQLLETYKIVFEAYAVVETQIDENSTNKEAKLMGDSVLILKDKKQNLLNKETIEDVITLEGILRIEEQEKRVPVGQASITFHLTQITESIQQPSTSQQPSASLQKDASSVHSIPPNLAKSKSSTQSLHTYTVKTPPLIEWPGIKHSNSIMIQINRWWGDNIDLWPESFVHVMHKTCGEVVTATHPKSELCVFLYRSFCLSTDFNGYFILCVLKITEFL